MIIDVIIRILAVDAIICNTSTCTLINKRELHICMLFQISVNADLLITYAQKMPPPPLPNVILDNKYMYIMLSLVNL